MTLNGLFAGQNPYPAISTHKNTHLPSQGGRNGVNPADVSFETLMNKTALDSTGDQETAKHIELVKEVGFYQYQMIMKAVDQIETALEKARADFSGYQDELKFTESIFEDRLPRSVAEAFKMLDTVLEQVPEEIREEFKDRVFQYLEEDKQNDWRQREEEMGLFGAIMNPGI